MEETNRRDKYFEHVTSDHLVYENNVLRKIIQEKEQQIHRLEYLITFFNINKAIKHFYEPEYKFTK